MYFFIIWHSKAIQHEIKICLDLLVTKDTVCSKLVWKVVFPKLDQFIWYQWSSKPYLHNCQFGCSMNSFSSNPQGKSPVLIPFQVNLINIHHTTFRQSSIINSTTFEPLIESIKVSKTHTWAWTTRNHKVHLCWKSALSRSLFPPFAGGSKPMIGLCFITLPILATNQLIPWTSSPYRVVTISFFLSTPLPLVPKRSVLFDHNIYNSNDHNYNSVLCHIPYPTTARETKRAFLCRRATKFSSKWRRKMKLLLRFSSFLFGVALSILSSRWLDGLSWWGPLRTWAAGTNPPEHEKSFPLFRRGTER